MSDHWHIVLDPSGHHRAMRYDQPAGPGESVVDTAPTYLEACRAADRLNTLAEVMES